MSDLDPAPPPSASPAPDAAPPPAPAAKPSMARWAATGAAVVAVALFAIPFLLGRDRDLVADPAAGNTDPSVAAARAACPANAPLAKLDFKVKDMHGADVRLASYKGQVILLNYWATWCGPCKVEIPDLVELQAQYKDKGFVVLGVSQDDDPETLRAFAGAYKMNYPVLVGRDVPELLDAQGPLWGLPTSYVIGRNGAVCTKHIGPATKEEFEREIKALL